ncbi:MAG: EamA family transporter [Alphaproteobacteria bacterium]|nr:EamA family transporter [Alphaproteobacteria bacterium]
MQKSVTESGGKTRHLKGITVTVLGVLVLTPDGLLTSLVEAPTLTQLFWRGLFMGLALSAFLALRYRSAVLREVRRLFTPARIAVGVLFAISSIGWVVAVVTTSVANTLFIVACAPLFSAIFARVFLGVRTSRHTIIAILISLAGMLIIFAEGLGRGDLLGNLAAMGTAFAWAGMVVILEHARIDDPAPSLALGGFLVAIFALVTAPTLAVSGVDLGWIAILGFFILPVSFFLIGLGPQYIPAPEVSLIMLLEAVIGPLWAWIFIAQFPSLQTMIGGAVILVTLAVHFAIGLARDARS